MRFWFGEDQARYVVTVTAAQAPLVAERARKAGVAVRNLGATGGDALTLGRAAHSGQNSGADIRRLAARLHGGQDDEHDPETWAPVFG